MSFKTVVYLLYSVVSIFDTVHRSQSAVTAFSSYQTHCEVNSLSQSLHYHFLDTSHLLGTCLVLANESLWLCYMCRSLQAANS